MTDSNDAFSEHAAFERGETGHELTTTPFETVVEIEDGEDGSDEPLYRVTITLPTLDGVVEGERVAEVVEEGWFETLERRLADPRQVTTGQSDVDSAVRWERTAVRVEMAFRSSDPERPAETAKALAEFVEGTWVQGIVPGYEYGEPAASLLDRATQNYDEGDA